MKGESAQTTDGERITRAADHSVIAYAVTAATAAIAAFTRFHPLLVILAAGVMGALGLI